ncbi:MAG: class I SAM-dependent methyltransferase [Paracoccaceae bacterium]
MADPARILLPFDDQLLTLPESGDVLYIRPPAILPQDFLEFSHIVCEQGFKPFSDCLTQENVTVVPTALGEYPMVLVALTRSRAENMANFARACRMVSADGQVVVSGDKTDGIDSMLKTVKKVYEIDGVFSKSHGKVFWLTPTTPAPAEWELAMRPKRNAFGYMTAPGMFSPEKIDVGSEMLTAYFDKSVKGAVADIGSGWGYLAKNILEKCERITSLDLFEAEHAALEVSRANVIDDRAAFHWVDVTAMDKPTEPYHTVICNPPFHQGRAAEPAIGISFIAAAARIMKPSGQFLMVANRQLPYESAMEAHFKHWEILEQNKAFKIIRARRPLKR